MSGLNWREELDKFYFNGLLNEICGYLFVFITIIDKTYQNTLLAINAISIYNRCIICSKGGFGMKEKTYYNEIKTLIEA